MGSRLFVPKGNDKKVSWSQSVNAILSHSHFLVFFFFSCLMHRDKAFISQNVSQQPSVKRPREWASRQFKGLWESTGPVRFPIVSAGSAVRQPNAQTVAGPLPKSISSTWPIRPRGQQVLASESSVILKPSPRGLTGLRTPPERVCGVYMPEGEDTAHCLGKKKPKRCPRQMLSSLDFNMNLIS